MKIRTNDKVKVIAGKDKGKVGKVLKVYKDTNKVLVEGINMVTKHIKPGLVNNEGGIVHIERPLTVSNVMFFDEKNDTATRLGYKIIDGKKYRVSKKSGEVIES